MTPISQKLYGRAGVIMTEDEEMAIDVIQEALDNRGSTTYCNDEVRRLLKFFKIKCGLYDNALNEIYSLRHSTKILEEELAEFQESARAYEEREADLRTAIYDIFGD